LIVGEQLKGQGVDEIERRQDIQGEPEEILHPNYQQLSRNVVGEGRGRWLPPGWSQLSRCGSLSDVGGFAPQEMSLMNVTFLQYVAH
jgi:hypothetical protein